MLSVLAHGRELQWQRLLVVGGDAGIEADASACLPLAKNPTAMALGNPLFFAWIWACGYAMAENYSF